MSFNKALAEFWGELQEICEMHSGQKPWLQRAAEQQACSSDTIIWEWKTTLFGVAPLVSQPSLRG